MAKKKAIKKAAPKKAAARRRAPQAKTKKAALRAKPRPAKKKVTAKKRPAPAPAVSRKSKAVTAGSQWVNPLLVVRNMKAAIQFYTAAFGFKVRSSMPGPDGALMHAELMHNDSLVMLGPENQERGSFAPQGPSPVTLYVFVENVDDTVQRAATAGGKVMMPVADMFWGDRCAVIVDPEGHSWMIATHIKDMTPEEMMKAMQSAPPPEPPPPVM